MQRKKRLCNPLMMLSVLHKPKRSAPKIAWMNMSVPREPSVTKLLPNLLNPGGLPFVNPHMILDIPLVTALPKTPPTEEHTILAMT